MQVLELSPQRTELYIEHQKLQAQLDKHIVRSLIITGAIVAIVPVSGVAALIVSPIALKQYWDTLKHQHRSTALAQELFTEEPEQ